MVTGDDSRADNKSFSGTVQDSRKGDRFHYIWAAVQALKLLDSRSRLQSIWVEGAAGAQVPGDEIIDVVEYYGEGDEPATEVAVRQLKYSSQRAAKDLGLADVRSTLEKFALIDQRSYKAFSVPPSTNVTYSLVTNRPIGASLKSSLRHVADGSATTPSSTQQKIIDILGPDPEAAASLARRISLDSDPTRLQSLRAHLDVRTAALVGTIDPGIPAMLVEAVSARASGEISESLRLADVALAFRVTADQLLPAPSMLSVAAQTFSRTCYGDLANKLLAAEETSLLTAVGGAGKSTFAALLPSILEGRAEVVIYDCYGNGRYRAADTPRHRHREGLVQISSELAAAGLCSPLVPAHGLEPADYMRAFSARLNEASAYLTSGNVKRHLVIVIDAADNAAIAASAHAGERTFVQDLWRIKLPPNVHIALTCRPYRASLLSPPTVLEPIELPEFSAEESAAMIRTRFPHAHRHNAAEFHRQTSGNPRTQALALENGETVEDCLRTLSAAVVGDGDALNNLLSTRLNRLLDEAGPERDALETTGRVLATLRPRIPMKVLAGLSGGSEQLIRSFVSDLGRGLIIADEAVQFLDEPTETFFRERYRLGSVDANLLVDQMAIFAQTDPYVAACLPQVLWEAERYEDLMVLGASDRGLSALSEVEARQIAQLRTSFALLAAFKLQRIPDIVKLSMLAGRAAASGERRYALLRNAADLTGEYLDRATLDELRGARLFPSPWPGAALSAEALMLAVSENGADEARTRLRAATDAMLAYVRLPREHGSTHVEPGQVAHIAITELFLEGPPAGAAFLERWRPERWILETAGIAASTLLSRGQDEATRDMGAAARTIAVALAIAAEQQRLGLEMGDEQLATAWALLRQKAPKFDLEDFNYARIADAVLRGVAWVAAEAVRKKRATRAQAVKLLSKYLPHKPPSDLGSEHGRSRVGMLLAYALRAHLRGEQITSEALAPTPAPPELPKKWRPDPRAEERARLNSVLPWLTHWARTRVEDVDEAESLALIKTYPTTRSRERDGWFLRRVAAPITTQLGRGAQSEGLVAQVRAIVAEAGTHSGAYLATDMIACLHGDERYAEVAYTCLNAVAEAVIQDKQTADQTVKDLIGVARAAYPFDRVEARGYFAQAVEIASRVGDDGWDRWRSVLSIAAVASGENEQDGFALASHLAHTAEEVEPYLGDGFDVEALVRAMSQLTGPRALAFVSRWRERRFGPLEYMVYSLVQSTPLFVDYPHLAMAFAPLADRINLSAHLASMAQRGELDDRRFDIVQHLAWRLGEHLDPGPLSSEVAAKFGVVPHSDPIPAVREPSSIFDRHDSTYEEDRRKLKSQARERLSRLDLTTTAGIAAAAAAIEDLGGADGIAALLDELTQRPVSKWGSIIRAVRTSDSLTPWQRGSLLQHFAHLRPSSRAVKTETAGLAKDFVSAEATDLVTGQAYPLSIEDLAGLIGASPRDLVHQALSSADPSHIVESSDDCYRLARTLASQLNTRESAEVLVAVLDSIDEDLDLPTWVDQATSLPEESTAEAATATFLWVAMADPRNDVRWRATHAVRFLLEYGDESVLESLTRAATTSHEHFVEATFPFYRMHAIENLLLAAERAAVTDPVQVISLLPLVASVQREFPDHIRIQSMCARIGHLTGDVPLKMAATIEPRPPQALPWSEMPRTSKPFEHGAPESEFRFDFELDEHRLAPLSASFRVDHADVLRSASDVILEEWNWRAKPELDADPRRLANVYTDGEAWSHRGDWPEADDFDFYLAYHAMFTVAGRLVRTETPLREVDEPSSRFEQWWSDLSLRRPDGRWISDARRPTPEGLGHDPSTSSQHWRWRFAETNFENAFLGEDGWITLDQEATNYAYGGYESISVSSALVGSRAATALLTSLQTAPSLLGGRLPGSDDEDNEIDSSLFRLTGWLTHNTSHTGIDKRDPLADSITYPVPRPANWVCQRHGLELRTDGLTWLTAEAEIAVETETWADKERGRHAHGPEGTRLRVSAKFLADLAEQAEAGVIVEVQLRRRPSRSGYSGTDEDDDEMRYTDDYVRYFLYTPADGWRDYLGRHISR
jgi:hypothetical protein